MPVDKATDRTVLDVLKSAVSELENKEISDSRLNAELLLCSVLNCKRLDLYVNYEKPIFESEEKKFNEFVLRRLRNEPLQYILGKTNFFGYNILLDRNVLIPRQETELLVERVLDDVIDSCKKIVSIFEIGTGSGCIVVALSKKLEKHNIDHEIFSIDISEKALETAKENLKLNGVSENRITIFHKDVFEIPRLKKSYDYIVSNPPYISKLDWSELPDEISKFEPKQALTDENDGLNFYKKIFDLFSDKEFKGKVFCEIGFGQKESIVNILDNEDFQEYTFYKDYSGIDRILKLEK